MVAGIVLPLTREWIEIKTDYIDILQRLVLPLTREWIEIHRSGKTSTRRKVLPLTREWIEMACALAMLDASGSSPSYEGVD